MFPQRKPASSSAVAGSLYSLRHQVEPTSLTAVSTERPQLAATAVCLGSALYTTDPVRQNDRLPMRCRPAPAANANAASARASRSRHCPLDLLVRYAGMLESEASRSHCQPAWALVLTRPPAGKARRAGRLARYISNIICIP